MITGFALEELTDATVGKTTFELAATGRQHREAPLTRKIRRRAHQPCLPDPCRPRDDDRRAMARRRLVERVRQGSELLTALEQTPRSMGLA